MAVNPPTLSQALAVSGFKLGTASAGIKSVELRGERPDVMLLSADVNCHAAAVLTQNKVRAACIDLAHTCLMGHASQVRAIVANSGNANACTGKLGQANAQQMIDVTAQALHIGEQQVLSASTGVIGQHLPMDRLEQGICQAAQSLSANHWHDAAQAILTTDTFAKYISREFHWQGHTYRITGIAKGSGMIHPNMATMLSFVATDAPVHTSDLQRIVPDVADHSFNSISVDGDTSTNDCLYVLASGLGLGDEPLTAEGLEVFHHELNALCVDLAQMIVRDGEGVSKFVSIVVNGADSVQQARHIGRSIAISPLVKTAFAGHDANWGRIIAAIGNSGEAVMVDNIHIFADDIHICQHGVIHPDYLDEDGMAVFAREEFVIRIELGLGHAHATVWTGDLTHDYITINAEYRT